MGSLDFYIEYNIEVPNIGEDFTFEPEPMSTLRNALNVIEKNVRDSREKLMQADPHRGEDLQTISHELSAEEVYGTYVEDIEPEELINQGRTGIANSLMLKEGLNQDAAYFAADQILRVAQRKIDSQ